MNGLAFFKKVFESEPRKDSSIIPRVTVVIVFEKEHYTITDVTHNRINLTYEAKGGTATTFIGEGLMFRILRMSMQGSMLLGNSKIVIDMADA